MLIASHLSGFGAGSGNRIVDITTNQVDYNLFVALGSPTGAQEIVVTINSGVNVTASSTSTPAFDTGPLPAGSTLRIINNGRIQGAGGRGGNGGQPASPGQSAFPGGIALNLTLDTTIDNGSGQIWGGGGGGGGGAGGAASGSGGGGGAGQVPGAGGSGNAAGSAGTSEAGGAGGLTAADGGTGGNPGAAGAAGQSTGSSGGAGGAAGKAVALNGHTVTWLAGSGSPNVKGPVA